MTALKYFLWWLLICYAAADVLVAWDDGVVIWPMFYVLDWGKLGDVKRRILP